GHQLTTVRSEDEPADWPAPRTERTARPGVPELEPTTTADDRAIVGTEGCERSPYPDVHGRPDRLCLSRVPVHHFTMSFQRQQATASVTEHYGGYRARQGISDRSARRRLQEHGPILQSGHDHTAIRAVGNIESVQGQDPLGRATIPEK